MFDSLGGDEDMVKFLVSIPGFYGSTEVEKDSQVLEQLNSIQLPCAIIHGSVLVTEPTSRGRKKDTDWDLPGRYQRGPFTCSMHVLADSSLW
jgi:hypothetical protein